MDEYINQGNVQKASDYMKAFQKLAGDISRSKLPKMVEGITLLRDIASALKYLHDDCKPSIIHKDIKLPNILLHYDSGKGRMVAKIADFGLSKKTFLPSVALEAFDATINPCWAAPEILSQKEGARYTNKADVYSFAVAMYEITHG